MNMKKKLPGVSLGDYLKERLKDPSFEKEWKQSEAQYQFVRQMIKMRLDKKVSQRELAKKAKTTQAVISRIESGTTSPSLGLLSRLAEGLDSSLTVCLN